MGLMSHVPRGPTKRLNSMLREAQSFAISRISSSVNSMMPVPWEMRCTVKPWRSISLKVAARAAGLLRWAVRCGIVLRPEIFWERRGDCKGHPRDSRAKLKKFLFLSPLNLWIVFPIQHSEQYLSSLLLYPGTATRCKLLLNWRYDGSWLWLPHQAGDSKVRR